MEAKLNSRVLIKMLVSNQTFKCTVGQSWGRAGIRFPGAVLHRASSMPAACRLATCRQCSGILRCEGRVLHPQGLRNGSLGSKRGFHRVAVSRLWCPHALVDAGGPDGAAGPGGQQHLHHRLGSWASWLLLAGPPALTWAHRERAVVRVSPS